MAVTSRCDGVPGMDCQAGPRISRAKSIYDRDDELPGRSKTTPTRKKIGEFYVLENNKSVFLGADPHCGDGSLFDAFAGAKRDR